MAETDFSLVDGRGRKYLTLQERTRFSWTYATFTPNSSLA